MAESFDISQIAQYADKTKKDLDKVARSVILQISTNIIIRTPVDSGRLINNWYPSFDTPSTQTTNRTGATGSAAIRRVRKALPRDIKFEGRTFYLTNNLPYARTAEYGGWGTGDYATTKTTRDGYSIQAPYGMVRISIAEANQALAKAISAL